MFLRSESKDTLSLSSVAAPRECYEPKKGRKCTEPEWESMSDVGTGMGTK